MIFQFHTFRFADLVGFTEFTTGYEDDRGANLAVSFYEHICGQAAELGCHVVEAIGDAAMVRSENNDAGIELASGSSVSLRRRAFRLPARDAMPTRVRVQR